jgi:branched-chain amino acid transport system ATP-binding protein
MGGVQKNLKRDRIRAMIRINDLNVGYGNLQVLWDVNVDINPGELVSLVGANAAGKSTLINAISGLLTPMSGDLLFLDQSFLQKTPDARVKLGIIQVPEGRKLFTGMTVLENLKLGAFSREDKDSIIQDLEWVLELFPELQMRKSQLSGTLSGGEQQMVAIGRALMGRPRLLLIDEFSLGLAPILVDRLVVAIRRIRSRSEMSILLVEQDVYLGLTMSERAFVIENGRITMSGLSRELIANDQIKAAYLGM